MISNVHNQIVFQDYQTDGASKIRVQNSITISDYKIVNTDANSLLLNQAGTGTFTTNINYIAMSVTSGQYAIVQSKVFHPYLSGKSTLIKMKTSSLGSATNVEKSMGYYTSSTVAPYTAGLDGFRIFKSTSDVYAIEVWRNNVRILNLLRTSWTDVLDGSGGATNPSGMNINFNNSNEFIFDFCYAGGRALGVYILYQGKFNLFAVYYYSNTDPLPMLNSPNKPLRWEIRSTTGSGSLNMIAGEVAVDGFTQVTPSTIDLASSPLGVSLPTVGTTYALVGVRKKTGYRDVFSFINIFEGAIKTNDFIKFSLVLNPTVAGTFTYADVTNTPFQTAVGVATNTVTGGLSLGSTLASLNMNNARIVNNMLARLGSTIDGTMDTLVLCGTPALASVNVNITSYMEVSYFN